jgi:RHH-type proline utilization regulon transcriptional repressor/proline dehydrogenase/delta 1-pyrroline-5-carboxylate dehydrogenase
MREMGNQFVLGEDIDAAMQAGRRAGGEGLHLFLRHAGRGRADGGGRGRFFDAYAGTPSRGSRAAALGDIARKPRHLGQALGAVSRATRRRSAPRSWPSSCRASRLARHAARARASASTSTPRRPTGSLSLDVIEAWPRPRASPAGTGSAWSCRPIRQARGRGARLAHALAGVARPPIMVRLVKGAYWDTEIKRAQVEGLAGFPVFTAQGGDGCLLPRLRAPAART